MDIKMNEVQYGQDLDKFRETWLQHTARENAILTNGKVKTLSNLQIATIYLFTGLEPSGEISNIDPLQRELEALVRARASALAEAFHQGRVPQ